MDFFIYQARVVLIHKVIFFMDSNKPKKKKEKIAKKKKKKPHNLQKNVKRIFDSFGKSTTKFKTV